MCTLYICKCLHITRVLICCCCLHRNLLMVRYGGFFFKYPDTWNYYKSKGRKYVCVWDGGGGGVIVQVFIHKSRTYQMLTVWKFHVYFLWFHKKKNVQRNGYIIDRYGKYMLSCIVKKNMKFFVKHCNYELIAHCLLDPFFMQFIECLRTLLT